MVDMTQQSSEGLNESYPPTVGYTQEKPGVLYNDNLGAITLTKNTKHNLHVKHIDIRHHFICECIKNGDITVFHVPSANNLHQQTLIFGYVTLCDTTAAMALCAKGTLLQVTTDKFKYKIK